jgi:hypothetical protein
MILILNINNQILQQFKYFDPLEFYLNVFIKLYPILLALDSFK